MTVADLIAKLHELPAELPVLIYFGDVGFEEVNRVTTGRFIRDEYAEAACSYIGRHEEAYAGGLQAGEPCVYLIHEEQEEHTL
jgi:hypothetical protein